MAFGCQLGMNEKSTTSVITMGRRCIDGPGMDRLEMEGGVVRREERRYFRRSTHLPLSITRRL